jgi:ligand-binding sensor domain-containing protein/DNA-binding CsgD family transcriptional regulator
VIRLFLTNDLPFCKICTWSILLFAQVCFGQLTNSSLHFDHLTIQEGLSHNTVYCILQDKHGYIWIGTQNGLNKYDGYSFEVYPSNESEFIGKKISALHEDRQGGFWVGTSKYGINYREKPGGQFKNLRPEPAFTSIDGYEVSSFFEDRAGNIWVTTVGAGVLKFNPQTNSSRHYTTENSGLSSNVVFDLVEDKYGTIWVAAAGGGLNYLLDNGHFELIHPMKPNDPNMSGFRKKLLLDDDYLWIGTEGTGLYQMHIKDHSYSHFAKGKAQGALHSNVVRDIHKLKDGRLFIATDGGGLNVYPTLSGEMSNYTYQMGQKTALNSNALFCLLEDRANNIWIGTYNGGLNIYKPNKVWFELFAPTLLGSEELSHRSILSIFQSRKGTIWIGTDGGGLNSFDLENNRFSPPPFKYTPSVPASLAGNAIKTIFEDSQERLWLGLFGAGLDVYDPITQSFKHVLEGTTSIWSIAEQKDGKLWIATMGNGLGMIDPQTEEINFFHHNQSVPNSLSDVNIMVVFVDSQDRVWIGTAENGLDRWNETNNHFIHYRHNPSDSFSIASNEIRAIFEDSRGDIWIGTEGGGLNRWLDDGQFQRISQEEGLISNNIMGVTEDQEGLLWITAFEGISRLNPASGAIRNFDFRTFQNTNQFNQMSILKSSNGQLFFGGINGLNTINPDEAQNDTLQSSILFTALKIFNKSIPVGTLPNGRVILAQPIEDAEMLQLSYQDKSFSIEFCATDYIYSKGNIFAYKMDGFDKDWQFTSAGQHSASYTNLDPGSYTFKVKHYNQEASIKVFIKPPFWQRLWFKCLLTISFLGAILFIFLFLMKRKEAEHKRQILRVNNEKLAAEVEAKNSKLMFSAVQMAHKNEILADVRKDLNGLHELAGVKLRQLIRKLDKELTSEDYWEEFNLYFNQVDQHFVSCMLERHPQLTQNDIRMCTLLRINLSTKEIASLLNISNRGVEQSRYRLKKRLGLSVEDDLTKYIAMFKTGD